LNVVDEDDSDGNFVLIDDFIGGRVPEAFGYSLRICDLGDNVDFCKMDAATYIATKDKDIFVEDIVISADIGSGPDAVVGNPKKLRFFIWELR